MQTKVRELNFDGDIIEIFAVFKDRYGSVLLDSALSNTYGNFSIIAINPYLELREKNQKLIVKNYAIQLDLSKYEEALSLDQFLQSYLKDNFETNDTTLPLIAGCLGYLSYDFGRKFEMIDTRHSDDIDVPDAIFMFYDNLIIQDIKRGKIYLTARGMLQDSDKVLDELTKIVSTSKSTSNVAKHDGLADYSSDFTKSAYKSAIDTMIDYIKTGDIYIANMTRRLQIQSEHDPFAVYTYLRQHNPAPFASYINYGDFEIVSASPERFLKVKDNIVQTRPIKGTRKRGATESEDNALSLELKNSGKDKSELLMIVDLERNDLNRVCKAGSVKVTELFEVEKYATVFHLVATIEGELRDDCDVVDLIRSAFPGGSITGAPKIRAMQIIDELENSRRNIYTGSIGYIGLNGDCDFNIVIRTLLHKADKYSLGVGGGITCESDLEFEYEETSQKAKALLEALAT